MRRLLRPVSDVWVNAVEPIGGRVFDALASPVALVLDDVHAGPGWRKAHLTSFG